MTDLAPDIEQIVVGGVDEAVVLPDQARAVSFLLPVTKRVGRAGGKPTDETFAASKLTKAQKEQFGLFSSPDAFERIEPYPGPESRARG